MRKNKNRGYQSEAHPPVNIVHFASKSVGAGEISPGFFFCPIVHFMCKVDYSQSKNVL